MRRSLLPLLLVITGVGLIVAYLVLRSAPTIPAAATTLPAPATTDLSIVTQPSLVGQPTRQLALNLETAPSRAPAAIESPDSTASLTPTAQPIFPTPTTHVISESAEFTVTTPASPPMSLTVSEPCPLPDCLRRVGVSGRKEIVSAANDAGLPFGQYLNWWAEMAPPEPGDVAFWQMVPITAAGPVLTWEALGQIVDARPGSIWIVGNEPDIIWQDNTPAERYAQIYHDVYSFIKQRDPEAQLAIAGVGQPTPLRLAYLDIVLKSYLETYGEPLPIDIWTIHAFVLREERDSWGVGIPPGMADDQGELYELTDHNNQAYFQQNLIHFRAWMAERGYGDRPLAVTEFGILHPAEYGFPPEVVAEFMIGAFEFFASAANETGYPEDDNRLVQWWFWYSVFDGGDFPTGNLFDPEEGQLTPLGQVFTSLVVGE